MLKLKNLTEEEKKALNRKLPTIVVTTLFVITSYFSLFGTAKVISLALTHYFGREFYLLPFIFFKFDGVAIYMIPIVAIPAMLGWLLGTRTKRFSKPRMRVISFVNSVWAVGTMVTAFGMTKLQDHLLPFFYARIGRVIETDDAVATALFSKTQSFFLLVELLPVILMMFMAMFLTTRYRRHDADLKKAFFTYKWTGERLRKFEELEKTTDNIVEYPNIELGINKETNEMVVLPGFDRTLNTAIVGSIGTGKTAALGLPIINQDLHYFTQFINKSPSYRHLENYVSEDIQGRFLNGLSIIEPSNDLCKKVYQLAKAHGISDDAITYIDPTNPNTPGLNFLKGPVEKVSEVFAQVLAGLADNGGGGNFYFEQAQRSHLKQHIYLLKLHKDEEVTFDDLMQMYEDANIVREMHMEFKARIREKFPEKEKEANLRDNRDRYNEWLLYNGIDKWFDNVIVQKTNFQGVPEKDVHGHAQYIDLFEKDVKGLRNILNDIGRNPLLARVLNGKSDFDFDKHMGGEGGILLVNTAKGSLEALGATLGKMVLMTLQNASFRREPNVSPFHHILVDEAPEYYYSAFASFPAQSRKFKVIITTLQQTLTQLRGAFGEDYMNSVIAAMRNRMVYADVSNFDGDYFSKMFGEKETFQEGETEQVVSPLQDDPVSRSGSTYQKVKDSALTAGDILFQEAFECAVKIVVENKTMPVQQIKANFVPKEEFTEAIVKVDADAMAEWVRLRYQESTELVLDEPLVTNDEELLEMHNEITAANRLAKEAIHAQAQKEESSQVVIDESERGLEVEIPSKPTVDLSKVVVPPKTAAAKEDIEVEGEQANDVLIPQVSLPKKQPKLNVSVPVTRRKSNSEQKAVAKEPVVEPKTELDTEPVTKPFVNEEKEQVKEKVAEPLQTVAMPTKSPKSKKAVEQPEVEVSTKEVEAEPEDETAPQKPNAKPLAPVSLPGGKKSGFKNDEVKKEGPKAEIAKEPVIKEQPFKQPSVEPSIKRSEPVQATPTSEKAPLLKTSLFQAKVYEPVKAPNAAKAETEASKEIEFKDSVIKDKASIEFGEKLNELDLTKENERFR